MTTSTLLMILAIIILFVLPSLKDRVISVRRLIIIPALFLYLFYQNIGDYFHVNIETNPIVMLGLVFGFCVGMLLRSKTVFQSDKENQLIKLPGSFLNAGIFIIIFAVHYAIGYVHAVHPQLLLNANETQTILLFLLSAASSLIVGANSLLFIKYYMNESNASLELKQRA